MEKSEEGKEIREGRKKYCIHKGKLFMEKRNARNQWVLCIPGREVKTVLKQYHDLSLHPGIVRMQRMLGNTITWPGMMGDVKNYVKSCLICQTHKPKPRKFVGPLQSVIPKNPREMLAIDILGPLVRSTYGYTCVLVLVDVFSKFLKLYGMRKATSRVCLNRVKRYIREYGKPRLVLSDNGTQFKSREWKEGLQELGVKSIRTAIRNPKCNPCERYVRTVGICLRILCSNDHTKWYEVLPKIEEFVNCGYSDATNELPIEVHFGKRIRLGIEECIEYPTVNEDISWIERKKKIRMVDQAVRRARYHRCKMV